MTRIKNICGNLIAVELLETDYVYCMDTHQAYHIILIDNGFLTLRVDEDIVTCCAPSAFVLKENMRVEFMTANMLSARICRFDVSFLCPLVNYEMINNGEYTDFADKGGLFPLDIFYKPKLPSHRLLPLSETEFSQATRLTAEFATELKDQKNPRWSCRARLCLGLLLELLHQSYCDSLNANIVWYDTKDKHIWVTKILKEIHSHYAEKIRVQSLADLVKINKNTVQKEFRAITGLSVNEYIIMYRLRCASLLLATNELKICEIAARCGYTDVAFFCTQFKERFSMTPTEYRKNIVSDRRTVSNAAISHPSYDEVSRRRRTTASSQRPL